MSTGFYIHNIRLVSFRPTTSVLHGSTRMEGNTTDTSKLISERHLQAPIVTIR